LQEIARRLVNCSHLSQRIRQLGRIRKDWIKQMKEFLKNTLKLADFGLCSSARQDFGCQGFRGTPPYAAPELYEGRTTSRTDQYSLAVTYYELSMGQRVFVQEGNDSATYGGRGEGVMPTKTPQHDRGMLGRETWSSN